LQEETRAGCVVTVNFGGAHAVIATVSRLAREMLGRTSATLLSVEINSPSRIGIGALAVGNTPDSLSQDSDEFNAFTVLASAGHVRA